MVAGVYPVTATGSALAVAIMISVVATPVAVPPSIAELHVPVLTVVVPREAVPLAITCGIVALALGKV